jgi:hypothetical protein
LLKFEEIEISRQNCRGDCEKQEGKFLRLLSAFRPRIRPLEKAGVGGYVGVSTESTEKING